MDHTRPDVQIRLHPAPLSDPKDGRPSLRSKRRGQESRAEMAAKSKGRGAYRAATERSTPCRGARRPLPVGAGARIAASYALAMRASPNASEAGEQGAVAGNSTLAAHREANDELTAPGADNSTTGLSPRRHLRVDGGIRRQVAMRPR
jgi:hypothetical protein